MPMAEYVIHELKSSFEINVSFDRNKRNLIHDC